MGDALTSEQPWFGTPREGRRRVLVSGVHRKVAGEFVSRLVADSNGRHPVPSNAESVVEMR